MIKYSDKLDAISNKSFTSEEYGVKGTSLEDIIEKISKSKKYKNNKDSISFVRISIEGLGTDSIVKMSDVMLSELSIFDFKKIISAIAENRYLELSPNMDEIYSEYILASDYDCEPIGIFDYGLMYGDFKPFVQNDIVEIPKWDFHTSYISSTYKLNELKYDRNSIIKKEDMDDSICFMYTGTFLNDKGEYVGELDTVDTPIPVSLFKPIKG